MIEKDVLITFRSLGYKRHRGARNRERYGQRSVAVHIGANVREAGVVVHILLLLHLIRRTRACGAAGHRGIPQRAACDGIGYLGNRTLGVSQRACSR